MLEYTETCCNLLEFDKIGLKRLEGLEWAGMGLNMLEWAGIGWLGWIRLEKARIGWNWLE